MKECTCYKAHIYGKCEYCKEWGMSDLMKQVRELIKKYPFEVKELIDQKVNNNITT